MKRPYTFPHRSRAAITQYLADHEGYHPMNSWNGGFVLAWNIKVYRLDSSGKSDGGVQARFDEAWLKHVEENDDMFWMCCGDATRYYTDGEWTNYPGIEQGEWKFGINGRSGGYMVLTEAPAWCPAPRAWRLYEMIWESRSAYEDWLADLDFKTLRRFYRAIRVLDKDLSGESVEREMAYQFCFQRQLWEEEQLADEKADADLMIEERPDMYEAGNEHARPE